MFVVEIFVPTNRHATELGRKKNKDTTGININKSKKRSIRPKESNQASKILGFENLSLSPVQEVSTEESLIFSDRILLCPESTLDANSSFQLQREETDSMESTYSDSDDEIIFRFSKEFR